MPRPRSKPKSSNQLLEACRFCSAITENSDRHTESFVVLNNKLVSAYSRTLSIGHSINEDLTAAPNNKLFIEALSKCNDNYSITQLQNSLSIKAECFKAIVPCIDPSTIPLDPPDQPSFPINNEFKKALEAISVLSHTDQEDILGATILMASNSVISSNRAAIFEYWHGVNLPTNIALPKAVIKPLCSTQKNLVQFGHSNSSVTFWFEDGAYIKTRLYDKQWPDVSKIFNQTANPSEIPKDFFQGLNAVAPFNDSNWVYFNQDKISSHDQDGIGAQFDVIGLPEGPIYNSKWLALLQPWATKIDFKMAGPHQGAFMLGAFGERMRGFIMAVGGK